MSSPMLGFLMLFRPMPQTMKISEEELICLRLQVWEAAERGHLKRCGWGEGHGKGKEIVGPAESQQS